MSNQEHAKYIEIYKSLFPHDIQDDLYIKSNLDIYSLSFGFISSFSNNEITRKNIIKLLDSEYVIFPTNKYYHLTYSSSSTGNIRIFGLSSNTTIRFNIIPSTWIIASITTICTQSTIN